MIFVSCVACLVAADRPVRVRRQGGYMGCWCSTTGEHCTQYTIKSQRQAVHTSAACACRTSILSVLVCVHDIMLDSSSLLHQLCLHLGCAIGSITSYRATNFSLQITQHMLCCLSVARDLMPCFELVLTLDTTDHHQLLQVMEPMFVPRPNASSEDDGWIIVTVHNAESGNGELAILDAQHISAGPVAVVHLQHFLPAGLHGSFTTQLWDNLGGENGLDAEPAWKEPNVVRAI